MDHGFQFTCLQESKRFIWLLVIIFAVLMVVQHFEFPYGGDLSSLLSSKVPFIRKSYSSDGELSLDSEMSGKDGENSTLKGNKSSVSSGTPKKAKDTEHNISSKEVAESNGSSFGIIQTRPLQGNLTRSNASSSLTDLPAVNKTSNISTMPVMPISKMNEVLQQSRSSPRSLPPQVFSKVDQELLYAKSQIENAPIIKNDTELHAFLYRNASMFKRKETGQVHGAPQDLPLNKFQGLV